MAAPAGRPPATSAVPPTCSNGPPIPTAAKAWFRIAEDAVARMPAETAAARDGRLVDALIVWITPARQLEPGINGGEGAPGPRVVLVKMDTPAPPRPRVVRHGGEDGHARP